MIVDWDQLKDFVDARGLSIQFIEFTNAYYIAAYDGMFSLEYYLSKVDNPADGTPQKVFETSYKALGNKKVGIVEPFADPLYRSKYDAITSPVTIAANSQGDVDFLISEERYAFGGSGFVTGAQPGDWFSACVVDADGVIPEAYRTSLSEPSPGYPVLNTYVIKEWVRVSAAGDAMFDVNTYPLIAKIPAGLYLRVTYHTANAGNNRVVYINYKLTKKL